MALHPDNDEDSSSPSPAEDKLRHLSEREERPPQQQQPRPAPDHVQATAGRPSGPEHVDVQADLVQAGSDYGYDCAFIHEPPDSTQTDCPVCLLVLRQPHQVSCCGYTFCRACIDALRLRDAPCPTCTATEFFVFEDKRLQRSLFSLKVYCSRRGEGCEWSGELGMLERHLNANPTPGERFLGCRFVGVCCAHCAKFISASQSRRAREGRMPITALLLRPLR